MRDINIIKALEMKIKQYLIIKSNKLHVVQSFLNTKKKNNVSAKLINHIQWIRSCFLNQTQKSVMNKDSSLESIEDSVSQKVGPL